MSTQPLPREAESRFLPSAALKYLATDALRRSRKVYRYLTPSAIYFFALVPKVSASPASAENDVFSNSTNPTIVSDVEDLVNLFNYSAWSGKANAIRYGTSRQQCLANLSIAISATGSLTEAGASGASGALTLLPTAGALIGTPTRELWVVYKLMPIAGVLSMLLSLGGNIVPTEASDYELNTSAFSYGGMIATHNSEEDEDKEDPSLAGQSEAQLFAAKVEKRSRNMVGGTKYIRVWYGIALQLLWLGVLLATCWFTQSGSIIVWWCKSWGWMFFWYLMLASASLLENFASVPFTKQWTLRVSRAPMVRISEDAPMVKQLGRNPITTNPNPNVDTAEYSNTEISKAPMVQAVEDVPFVQRTASGRSTEILDALEAGFNCRGQVVRDSSEPWSSSRVPFYVIISLEGVSGSHAVLRVVSKAISVGVYAAGTAMFASAQLITISVALTILCLVLGAGVFGRVIAMWMASEMMKTKPVLHRVVKTRGLAAEHIDNILSIDGLIIEVMGHVIVNGRCIARYNQWLRLSNWLGVLAGPYNLGKLAVLT